LTLDGANERAESGECLVGWTGLVFGVGCAAVDAVPRREFASLSSGRRSEGNRRESKLVALSVPLAHTLM
jgi:hypothetical protein